MTDTPRRFFRLQFGLRWLLALMLLPAMVLAALRWTWHDYLVHPAGADRQEFVTVRAYHHDWNRKRVFHGPTRDFEFATDQGMEKIFSEGELLEERIYLHGELSSVRSPNDVTSKPPDELKQIRRTAPPITGRWRYECPHENDTTCLDVSWRNAQRHGPAIWKSAEGKVLQSAEFERGRIVRWNGEPVADAFARFLHERVPDAELRSVLLTPIDEEQLTWQHSQVNDLGFVWIPLTPGPPVLVQCGLDERRTFSPAPWLPRYNDRVFGEVLLETALANWSTLDYRYGTLYCIPISTYESNWQNPTGSELVRFPAGSREETLWNEPFVNDPELHRSPAARLKEIVSDLPIVLDTSAIEVLDPTHPSTPLAALPYYPRPRRHLFGHVLFTAGYVCREVEGQLVVTRAD